MEPWPEPLEFPAAPTPPRPPPTEPLMRDRPPLTEAEPWPMLPPCPLPDSPVSSVSGERGSEEEEERPGPPPPPPMDEAMREMEPLPAVPRRPTAALP